jgi:glyoxylase-like metal-dependent hydrolase (beta-lactamase superfamily II)
MITNLHAEVAPGVHRIEHSFTNFYLLEDGDRLTLVDAGVPTAWEPLHAALRTIGRALDDIQALVLTHAARHPRVRARERRPAHPASLAL